MSEDEEKPTKAELSRIAQDLIVSMRPVLEKYPGIKVAVSLVYPRPADPNRLAHCLATTMEPSLALRILDEGKRDLLLLLRKDQP
jgi:hypothetical protein